MDVNLILANQLFPVKTESKVIILLRPPELFQKTFSKVKTGYLEKCVSAYVKKLSKTTKVVQVNTYTDLHAVCHRHRIPTLIAYDINDFTIEKNIRKVSRLQTLETPMFLNSRARNATLLSKNKLFFTSFYIRQRKDLDILVKDQKPVGGKWTFDTENRMKMPAKIAEKLKGTPTFPTTRQAALAMLKTFIEKKLPTFGDYQDYVDKDNILLFHSGLSAPLNVGLITPNDILKAIHGSKAPIKSLEAFVRQIIGWREFMRGLYQVHHDKLKSSNFFGHTKTIPKSFYDATTGILPLDNSIKRLKKYGYVHHIERLMIIGCLFMLCEVHPLEVYKWFMELSIDAYEWVMLSNVMVMSQFACGPFATTKPYFCASAYILRMSNYSRGPWCEVWDALFWRFVGKHRAFFKTQPRLAVLTKNIESKVKKSFEILNKS